MVKVSQVVVGAFFALVLFVAPASAQAQDPDNPCPAGQTPVANPNSPRYPICRPIGRGVGADDASRPAPSAGAGTLRRTGIDADQLVAIGIVLVAGGALVVIGAKRRRTASAAA